jgi:hypothetical protein
MSKERNIIIDNTSENTIFLRWQTPNGTILGSVVKEVDGYYHFLPKGNLGGIWSSYVLREISEILDEMNEEWNNIVGNELG